MRRLYVLTIATLNFLLVNQLLAQQTLQVQMNGRVMRHQMEAGKGQSDIHLCDLAPGNTYTVIALGAVLDQQAVFALSSDDPAVKNVSTIAGRPYYIRFLAAETCVTLKLNIDAAGDEVPMFLSVKCEDCPVDNTWKEKFLEKVGSIANLSTSGGATASSLISTTLIGGDCFDVANITSSGNAASRGTFTNGATNIGLANGVVLCTGNVNILPGPNILQNADGGFGNNSTDDPDLATLTTGDQYDVSKIEFDFTPTTDQVTFDFVFGSEEYCEYVGSQFNDVFGFFISGPGIVGTKNIALVPGTSIPVAINNVNHISNTSYYVNNNTGISCNGSPAFNLAECQLDGWTTVLTAEAVVQPCKTYHIKLAIADVADPYYDSAVFLKANSFDAGGQAHVQAAYPSGLQNVYEGCGQGYIEFVRGSGDVNQPLVVNFTVGGTATPGSDYIPISSPVTIPAGQSKIQIPITVISDTIVEGQESIILSLKNPCSCTQQKAEFFIDDLSPLNVELNDQTICGNTGATLSPTVTGGLTPLSYLWSNGLTTPSITVNTQGTNTYFVTVTDNCGSTGVQSAVVTIQPTPTATISGSGHFCKGVPGSVELKVTLTGTGPWDVAYNDNGNTQLATFASSPGIITATQPGTYSLVSVTSQNGCTGTVSGNVNIQEISVNLALNGTDPVCFGIKNGSIQASASGGSAPYNYIWNTGFSGPDYTNIGSGTYAVTVTSIEGCTAVDSMTLTEPPLLVASIDSSQNIDCNNPVGSASLEVTGGTPGYTYVWSNGSKQKDPYFTSGGTFSVTVTDGAGCTQTPSVTISANTTLPTALIAPPGQITCITEEITLNGSGSSQGGQYTLEWSGPGFVCCQNTLQPVVNEGGAYSLLITNTQTGCTATYQTTVTENKDYPSAIDLFSQPPACSARPGIIRFEEVSGGVGPYQYSIDGGATFHTINEFKNLGPGTYDLVVQGSNGCRYAESLVFPVPVEPDISIDPEIQLAFGESATLTALLNIPPNKVDTIIWSPTENLIPTSEPWIVEVKPYQSTKYSVMLIDVNGCEDRAVVNVRVGNPLIWVPNVFSPIKQDGNNDRFLIFAAGNTVKNIKTFQVFDRWGAELFHKDNLQPNDENLGWDGRYRGKLLEPGVFVWYAEVELIDGRLILLKGDVTIAN